MLVKGQPLDDIALMAEPDNVVVVLQDGVVVKDSEGRLRLSAAALLGSTGAAGGSAAESGPDGVQSAF